MLSNSDTVFTSVFAKERYMLQREKVVSSSLSSDVKYERHTSNALGLFKIGSWSSSNHSTPPLCLVQIAESGERPWCRWGC